MNFSEYQQRAVLTDRHPGSESVAMEIPLFGLAGEVGTLLSKYKKYLRDGDAHQLFRDEVTEELGDILWYLSNAATKFGIALDDVAERNLKKTADRWNPNADAPHFFDSSFPVSERLPRWFDANFSEEIAPNGRRRVYVFWEDRQIGNFLTDNAHVPDGYRFHDAFHFSYACVLGWSPVMRRNLGIKRKSVPEIDEVEDGARAIIYEEYIAAMVFEDARAHGFYEAKHTLDFGLLDAIKRLTAQLEVRVRSRREWEQAIISGFEIWRRLVREGGGVVRYDLENRTMTYYGKAASTASS